jgi:hypothetical protein
MDADMDIMMYMLSNCADIDDFDTRLYINTVLCLHKYYCNAAKVKCNICSLKESIYLCEFLKTYIRKQKISPQITLSKVICFYIQCTLNF